MITITAGFRPDKKHVILKTDKGSEFSFPVEDVPDIIEGLRVAATDGAREVADVDCAFEPRLLLKPAGALRLAALMEEVHRFLTSKPH